MGDYEKNQQYMEKVWDEFLSDEDNTSEVGYVYLSDLVLRMKKNLLMKKFQFLKNVLSKMELIKYLVDVLTPTAFAVADKTDEIRSGQQKSNNDKIDQTIQRVIDEFQNPEVDDIIYTCR